MSKYKLILIVTILGLTVGRAVLALEPGTILYRSSSDGQMYGFNSKELITQRYGVITNIYSGHAAIYIGQEDGVDYVVEALGSGIVKTPAQYFVNKNNGETLVAAKIPSQASVWQRARAVTLAKYLASADLAYDFDFSTQKGPWSGDWTCVGLSEKIYESANANNPERLGALEYDPHYYAVDITPDGFDHDSLYNEQGDCFSTRREFSKIARRVTTILPAPEILGFNAGKEFEGSRYLFLPYTQAKQKSLVDVPVDIELSGDFADNAIRGKVSNLGIILKWSLIDNPYSSVKSVAGKIAKGVKYLFSGQEENTALVWSEGEEPGILAATDNESINIKENMAVIKDNNTPNPVNPSSVKPSATADETEEKNDIEVDDSEAVSEWDDNNQTDVTDDIFNAIRPQISVANEVANNSAAVAMATSSKAISAKSVSIWSPVAKKIASSTTTTTNSTSTKATSTVETEIEMAPLTLVISRLHTTGDDDWLELWNYGQDDIDLAARKIRLEKSKTALDPGIILRFDNTADATFPGGSVVRAGEAYRIVRDEASSDLRAAAQAIATRADFTLMDNAYTVYLASGVVSSPDDEDIIDYVGYGAAKYFEGAAPALALTEGYLLRRKADASTQLSDLLNNGSKANWAPKYDSDNNNRDFLIWPLGGVVPTTPEEENDNGVENDDSNNQDDSSSSTPFTLMPGVDSAGLVRLWSFDDCQGSSSVDMINKKAGTALTGLNLWSLGRWGCGQTLAYAPTVITANFAPALSGEAFSLGFQFKGDGAYSTMYLVLENLASGINLRLDLYSKMMEFDGFPGLRGRYQGPDYMDNQWHQAILVWNAIGGNWGLFIDGDEIFHSDFSGLAPDFDQLRFGGVAGEVVIDDLAVWNRSLAATEISAFAEQKQPFNPQLERASPPEINLLHAWYFNEATSTIAQDTVGNINWVLPAGSIVYNGVTGRALNSPFVDIPYQLSLLAISTNNYSLSWWWQNSAALPYSGHFHLHLKEGEKLLAALGAENWRQSLYVNGMEKIWAEGNEVLPADNLWHHLALVYDNYRYLWQFYVDGELKLQSWRLPPPSGSEINNISLSSTVNEYKIDNFKIWQGSLDAAKVLAEYQSEKP